MQSRAPAVDEALSEGGMQRFREAVFDLLRAGLPMTGIMHPVRTVRDVGPGAHMRDTLRQLIDITVNAVEARDLVRDPVVRQPALDEEPIELRQKPDMRIGHQLAEIRHLADLPQQRNAIATTRQ